MSGLETIKNELKTQKQLIQEKGGRIIVKNDYPSPSEITDGIKTIETPDFTLPTATEEDVLAGKTFYSNTPELKTGVGTFDPTAMYYIFMPNNQVVQTDRTFYCTCPQNLNSIRAYQFQYNYNYVVLEFNPDLTYIGESSFYYAVNMQFRGFNEMKKIQTVAQNAFSNTTGLDMNVYQAPNCLKTIGPNAFYNVYNENYTDFRFPDSIESLGSSAFRQTNKKVINSLDLTNFKMTQFANHIFNNIAFNCDFVSPSALKTINNSFNYNGSFKNIYISSNVTKVDTYCFGADTTKSLSEFYLQTVTFERETPPTFGTNVFAHQNIQNGFKIYVPDNSVEAYKAVTNLSPYINCIFPISQKE